MKKITVIGLLLILFAFASHAQGIYSKQKLEKASREDLNLYLKFAKKKQKTGVIMTIVGPLACVGGTALVAHAYGGGTVSELAAGSIIFLGGLVTTAVGIPILITGSVRKNKVKKAINANVGLSLNGTPDFLFNNITQNPYPVVSLRIRF